VKISVGFTDCGESSGTSGTAGTAGTAISQPPVLTTQDLSIVNAFSAALEGFRFVILLFIATEISWQLSLDKSAVVNTAVVFRT
jgi:hypothetical protein